MPHSNLCTDMIIIYQFKITVVYNNNFGVLRFVIAEKSPCIQHNIRIMCTAVS